MGLGFHGPPGEAVRTVADWNSYGSYLLKFELGLLRHVSLTNRLRFRRRSEERLGTLTPIQGARSLTMTGRILPHFG